MRLFSGKKTDRPPYFAIALVSATALAYELLLLRLFSIIQWHHFAYLIISLAMLGYGASGTFLSFFRSRLLRMFPRVFVVNIVLFGTATVLCFHAAQKISFNPEEILWNPRQFFSLFLIYLLLSLPFFFAANTVALCFSRYQNRISALYAFDLGGAGLGSGLIILLLFYLYPLKILHILGAMGIGAAVLACFELGAFAGKVRLLLLLLALSTPVLLSPWTRMHISPYKSLSQQLQIGGSQEVATFSSPLGLLTVVENRAVPLRYAPGLSIQAQTSIPEQLAVFSDADGLTAIQKKRDIVADAAFLDQQTSALPYHLGTRQRVLVLGGGGGSDVLQAQYHNVPGIDVVELNPQMVELVRDQFGDYAGHLYDGPGVRVHVADARGYLVRSREKYDLIQCSLLDSFGAAASGLSALRENFLYTTEAFGEFIAHLRPGGCLAITRWVRLPPRDTLKLLATAVEALEEAGVPEPGKRLLLIRGWQTSTLLVKNGEISGEEIAGLKRFCRDRAFDSVYYPGITPEEANRYNLLREDFFYEGARKILADGRREFYREYKFSITPATDDRPYFFHFFKWSALPEILKLRGQGGFGLLEWGYPVLVLTLLQAVLAGAVLIVAPAVFLFRKARPATGGRPQIFVYFFSIGLAFLFLEIACIQKSILFLSHPLYATTVVITAFLCFAGLGSAWSQKKISALAGRRRPFAGIVLCGSLYLFGIEFFSKQLILLPEWGAVLLLIAGMAPLAFFMGMPFPLGLARLAEKSAAAVPWAWAVNGCASVLSSVVATLIALHWGFTILVLCALLLYLIASLVAPAAPDDIVADKKIFL